MPAARPADVPAWAAEPDATAADSSREEAIAEVLRSALAQGHSDDALAGILRKVLAGASPQTALTEPSLAPELALPNVVAELEAAPVAVPLADPVDELSVDTVVDLPAIDIAAHLPEIALPETELPGTDMPGIDLGWADLRAPEADPEPIVEPVPAAVPAQPTWAELASQSTLWADAVPVPGTAGHADAPIWAEVVRHEPVHTLLFPPVPAPVVAETVAAPVVVPEAPAVVELLVEPLAAEPVAAEPEVEAVAQHAPEEIAEAAEETVVEMAPLLARTASDPAPMSLDATTVMPPLSLLPPLPGVRGRGRPPVPPAVSRPPVPSAPVRTSSPAPAPAADEVAPEVPETVPTVSSLATVTRLPVAPLMPTPEAPELEDLAEALEPLAVDLPAEPAAPEITPRPTAPAAEPVALTPAAEPGDVVARLEALGVPSELLGSGFASDVAVQGTYAALTRALGRRLPEAPELPVGAGDVLFVVGPGVETLRAARSLAATLRLDPERVQWATRGDLVGLAPESSRMATIDAAIDRRQAAAGAGTVTIVAVDAPMRTDAYWMAQMLAIWSPVAVWAVVEATRKPEDLESWLEGLSRVDALIVQDTDLSADPAAVLRRIAAPVAVVDGVRATPHRWASLLCERLEGAQS
jgi:hypothetical protein